MRAAERAAGLVRTFRRGATGVAGVEFALVLPILLTISAGTYEYANFIRQSRQLTDTANNIAEILSMNNRNYVTYVDLHYANDSTMLTFPPVLADSAKRGLSWDADIQVSMAGVSFTPTVSGCSSGCTYKANIVWTGGDAARSCGTNPAAAPDAAAPTPTTLPTSLFTAVPDPNGNSLPPPFVIVADVSYAWSPLIFNGIFPNVTLKSSAYINPRYVTAMNYTAISGDDAFGKQCPGF
ncbi:TadE/TadG family type IV pilus assembly protein [Methylobacterium sp. JK268]